MRNGLVFHHTPYLPMSELTTWCVLEYASPHGENAVAAIFKTSAEGEDDYRFLPRGLDQSLRYAVMLDNERVTYQAFGYELAQNGILIRLEQPMRSALIICQAIEQ